MWPQFQGAWDSQTGVNMFRTAAVLLVSLCLFATPIATFGQSPARLELSQDWKLAAAKEVSADGVALSQPAYDDHKWLLIHRMPAIVLEILQEDGVYPDLYIGKNLLEKGDQDEQFLEAGKGGNFYLQVNGRDFLVRGGVYTPDLLYRYDPEREAEILRYVKDLGLNMLRWESKISSEHIVELADEQGIPLIFGWMCCNQWEKWDQWSQEDHRVASQSLRSQILMLRPHASVFIWANGSDGLPPPTIQQEYHRILSELHWKNAMVDTVSSFAKGANGERLWDGIHMAGPYSWRPPTYWFSGKYVASRGACAEQGDNEHIPTLDSLKKFIPADKLWPINDTWFMHSGVFGGNATLANIQLALNRRYGPARNVEDFVRKAQLAHYENTHAQFEDFAADGWANHKMTWVTEKMIPPCTCSK
jgi:exo-1,4-beta-D-glucosaminidase